MVERDLRRCRARRRWRSVRDWGVRVDVEVAVFLACSKGKEGGRLASG
jgi:hypothetical protein